MISIFFKAPGTHKNETLGFKARLNQFDPIGTSVFIPAVVCLLLALSWGGSKYPWGNGRIIALFVVAGVLLIVFTAVQFWKGDNATLPLRIVSQRSIAFGTIFTFCLGGAFLLMVFYLPIWFQAIKGVSAVKSGIMNLPMILALVIISIVAGATVSIVGYYTPLMYVSTVIMAIGAGLLTTFKVDTGHAKWIGYQTLFGIGVGLGMQQPLMAAQTVLSIEDVPIGTSAMIFGQSLGGALMISVGQSVSTYPL